VAPRTWSRSESQLFWQLKRRVAVL
jgi:hypothetical protein